jgi:succinate dehydrogenase / fumarate reductase cytochrome b subunit
MRPSLLRSSLGKKTVVALSGVILIGFVIMHLAGNLLVFRGPDALNAYAQKLRHLGPWLWVARVGLIAAAIAHVVASVLVTIENRRARPIPYAVQRTAKTTLGARTMALSGLLLLAFLVYHLLHFTFRVTHPEISHATDAAGRHHVYAMVVLSFQDLRLSLAYVAAMALLCLHLGHGIASTGQTLGLLTERTLPAAEWIGRIAALAVFIGYVSIPLAVLAGVIPPPAELR